MRRLLLGLAVFSLITTCLQATDWPQWLGPKRDGVWRESGLLEKFPEKGLNIRWRTPLGKGYAGPAVANGHVFVMDWNRLKDKDGNNIKPTKEGIPGNERLLCLDETTGKIAWEYTYEAKYKLSYPNGPRVTPVIENDRVYGIGAMGHFFCVDARTGKEVWSKNLTKTYSTEPPVWGFSAHPLIVGDLIYTLVGGKDSAVVAFDKKTGEEKWKALNAQEVGYAPPILMNAAGQDQLIIWLSETLNGLDPKTGKVLWTHKYPSDGKVDRPAVSIAMPRQVDKDQLFITTVYHGPLMVKLHQDTPAASVVWQVAGNMAKLPEGLTALMATPVYLKGHLYGVDMKGRLMCCDANDGKVKWETFDPIIDDKARASKRKIREIDCGNAFLVQLGEGSEHFLLFNDTGYVIKARLTSEKYEELGRFKLIEPTHDARGRTVVWSHPACANKHIYARNDNEILSASMQQQ
ncbi:MAG: PQQ-binding-like beta-propeller repeat protein [Gemmatales bacterium]